MKVLFVLADLGGDFKKESPFIFSQGESLKKLGIELDYFLLKGKSFLKYIMGISQLRKHLKEKKYDILHAHYSYTGWTIIQSKMKPVVVSLMGSDIYCNENFIIKYLNQIILNNVLNNSEFIICKSKRMIEKISRKNNVCVIPNGVDFKTFFPIEKNEAKGSLNLNLQKKYILFVGDIKRREKNYKLAKEVFNVLNMENIELLNVNNVSQKTLNFYYNASDVLLMTSLYEGSPNIIKEAMACNLPIVSTDVGDVKERIKGVKNCFIVDYSALEMKNRIKMICKSGERSNGRKIINNLEISKVARNLKKIYKLIYQNAKCSFYC